MADLSYHHGPKLVESPDTPSLLRVSQHGVTFANGTAPNADPAQFGIDDPVLVTSPTQLAGLGLGGTLRDDVATVFAEGGSWVIINRVEHSDNPATLAANLIGDPIARTGLYSALRAKAKLGVTPRVLITAGDTGSFIDGGIVSVSVTNGGAGYTEAPAVAFSTGGAAATAVINRHMIGSIAVSAAGSGYASAPAVEIAAPPEGGTQATATATVEDGAVTGIVVTNPGTGYVEAPAVTISGGGGEGAAVAATLVGPVTAIVVTNPGQDYENAPTVTLTGGGGGSGALAVANVGDVANGFISALASITEQIRARAYVSGPNTTNAEAVRWRNTINGRVLPIDPLGIKNVNGVPVPVPSVPVFAGIRARVVASAEGVSGSVSNKIIRTLDGVARTISYPHDSNYLNERQVATIINERGGLRTWGSRLATDVALWQFDHVRATADMVNEALEDLFFEWVDRKATSGNLKMLVEDGNNAMRVFEKNEDTYGGRVWLSDLNVPTLNANGKWFLNVEFEPVGIMEQIHVTTHRNILRYTLLLDQVRGAIEYGPLAVAA